MVKIRLPYKTNLRKMVVSGILGAWLHVVLDGFYHYDVQPFWPNPANPFYKLQWVTQKQVVLICIVFWVLSIMLYIFYIIGNIKAKRSAKNPEIQK